MADTNLDELGPVDYLLVSFPEDKADFSGEMAAQLRTLIESNTIRVLDLMMIVKAADGSVDVAEVRDVEDSPLGDLRELERELAVLLAEEDIERFAEDLDPAAAAALLIYENTWAAPFAAALRHSGGEVVGNGRIPTQMLIAAVEAALEGGDEGGDEGEGEDEEA
jgi:Family of unknown function (DUF6325)